MVFNKFKNIFNQSIDTTSKYSVNHLLKLIVADPVNADKKIFLHARLKYLSKYYYPRNIGQGGRIVLSNLNTTAPDKVIRQVPHSIVHTIDQEHLLCAVPDINEFNIKEYKFGDFYNPKTELCIEAKTINELSAWSVGNLVNQYEYNKRNDKFLFSIFYKKLGWKKEYAEDYIVKNLGIQKDQVYIKPLSEIVDYFTDENIEKFIQYHNISWLEYKLIVDTMLYKNIAELSELPNLTTIQKRGIEKFLKEMRGELNAVQKRKRSKNPQYSYKNTLLLPKDSNQKDPIDEDVLTPEDFLEDARGWLFNENDD